MQKLEEEIRLSQSNVSNKETGAWIKLMVCVLLSLLIFFDQRILLKISAILFAATLLVMSIFELDATRSYNEKTILPKKKELKKLRLIELIRKEARSVAIDAGSSIKSEEG